MVKLKKIIMKKAIFAAAIFCISMFIISCGGSGGDPKETLMSFFDAMAKKDITTARKFCTADSKSMLDMMETGMNMDKNNADKKPDNKYNRDSVDFSAPKIEGDKATITVKKKGETESIDFIMKKEKGDWKVAFDKASMAGMIGDKIKEKGGPSLDSLTRGMEELKNMNMDSLNNVMKEGMKAMDSVTKALKELKDK